jgi:hypothetical protein
VQYDLRKKLSNDRRLAPVRASFQCLNRLPEACPLFSHFRPKLGQLVFQRGQLELPERQLLLKFLTTGSCQGPLSLVLGGLLRQHPPLVLLGQRIQLLPGELDLLLLEGDEQAAGLLDGAEVQPCCNFVYFFAEIIVVDRPVGVPGKKAAERLLAACRDVHRINLRQVVTQTMLDNEGDLLLERHELKKDVVERPGFAGGQ